MLTAMMSSISSKFAENIGSGGNDESDASSDESNNSDGAVTDDDDDDKEESEAENEHEVTIPQSWIRHKKNLVGDVLSAGSCFV